VRFVKKLVLQGYKTFASRSEFAFDAGTTAIVGPNGSGKSNVADSLRWVLGEQSYGTLRGKRTEDMIFSGSELRPRAGMAHVAVLLDNSAGWLPIDFTEVEIARRAYRTGENEYYLNGNRVRLRDIVELLGRSGLSERTYSVIGQGLVDQALSQRPEERRRLFEEAAGINVYQAKRDQSAQKLQEVSANLTRARDIIAELSPRLRYLKGQARRAQEYQQLRRDLELQLRVWYGFRWQQAISGIAAARTRVHDATAAYAEHEVSLDGVLAESTRLREARAAVREVLSGWHSESSNLHRQAETIQRQLAVRSEQVRLWAEQEEEIERELVRLRTALEDGASRLAAAEAAMAEAAASHGLHTERTAAAQAALESQERAHREALAEAAREQDALLVLRTLVVDVESRLAGLAEERARLTAATEQLGAARAESEGQLREARGKAAVASARVTEAESALEGIEKSRQDQAQLATRAQQEERQAAEQLADAKRATGRLHDQEEMLRKLQAEGAGLGAGARAVLVAARSPGGDLQGILGTLGELIQVPAELDRAVEAALGGRVQDIVVERWQDAEEAVDFLKRRQAGRATFLPIDSLRPGRPTQSPGGAGILGIASDLIAFHPRLRPAVELALNHTLIVRDLDTARRLLGQAGATLVTLEGEIVRPGGSVTGGAESKGRDGGILARARALRELPAQIAAAEEEAARRSAALDALRARQRQLAEAANAIAEMQRQAGAALGLRRSESQDARLAEARSQQALHWHEEQVKKAGQGVADLNAREAGLRRDLASLVERYSAQEARLRLAENVATSLRTDELVFDLAQIRASGAVTAGSLQAAQARVGELTALQADRSAEIQARAGRLLALQRQYGEAQAAAASFEAEAGRLASAIQDLAGRIDPEEARLAGLDEAQRAAEADEQTWREQLRVAQMRLSQAELAQQRAQDELDHLRDEIEKELGLVVLTSPDGAIGGDSLDTQPPLPLNGTVTEITLVTHIPEGLDQDVRNLRAQLARLGPVNLDALTEFNEVEARFNFLSTQAADLEQAVESLQQVIAELDMVMEREFMATFKAVASQFREEFSNLFGGGSAKLTLSDPENPATTGVEIVARPPGKREQGLALLSGGERALTAAALIFSILKTRPTPFCVLDEVDAALDEANVGRFRDAIKSLSSDTQFILITHNRGTIEVADTIYGISMGPDHTSQTLSLRLDGRELVPLEKAEAD
jgi:chromosome segregation protein